MSPFPWEELQRSLLLQPASAPGHNLYSTAGDVGTKIVAHSLYKELGWAGVIASGLFSFPHPVGKLEQKGLGP